MAQLNCRVGDLAITVRFNQPENVGIIVQIVGVCMYIDTWEGFEHPIHIWDVDVICKDSHIAYFSDEPIPTRLLFKGGPIPDAFLQPITAPINEEDLLRAEALEEERKGK